MNHAIRIHEYGGPERMVWDEIPLPAPKPGEALVRHHAVGLNYIDVYFRSGLYKAPALPAIIGMEGAGIVEAVGDGVTDIAPGDRVAYATAPIGAYAEARTIKADRLFRLPAAIDFETGAAMMLQGMTAQYLLRRTYPVKPGETILVHAAAGGVGLILCQWAKHLGCTVIGTVSTDAKADLARAHGCDHPIIYTREDFAARVRELTDGKLLPVVYDSIGKDTFAKSLECLAPYGMMVVYGNASGPVPPFDIGQLSAKGSLYLTRPTLATYTAKRDELVASANELFDVVAKGVVKIEIHQRFPLAEAAAAHAALEARRTTGSTLLLP
jgi:NADPH2:quinone reductase